MEQVKTDRKEAAVAPTKRDRGLNGLEGKQIVLILQGGGSLGAYQVGAFEALASECAKAKNKIYWVAGISIGAINAAVIAAPKKRGDAKKGDPVAELENLWDEIRSQFSYTDVMAAWAPWLGHAWISALEPKYMDWLQMAFSPFGQANFFSSRVLNPFRNPWVQQWFRKLDRNDLGFYGTGRLTETLEDCVDWKGLNDHRPTDDQKHNGEKQTRLSLGATHVCDGEVEFFNSWEAELTPDHVRASAAIPPAFPPVQIGSEWYWDGGVPNNTPIEGLARELYKLEKETVIFVIDLFDRKNDVFPESFDSLLWRQKCIQFGSRKNAVETFVRHYNHLAENHKLEHPVQLQVCQLMLELDDQESQFCFGDADFSRKTFEELRDRGFRDMMNALDHAELVGDTEAFDHADPIVKEEKRLLKGPRASLYRLGSLGKWKSSRVAHRHHASNRSDLPPVLEPWVEWWKHFAY